MIEITQEELNAFNILAAQSLKIQQQLIQAKAAQDAFIKLLEVKYKAVFDPETGLITPIEKKDKGNK